MIKNTRDTLLDNLQRFSSNNEYTFEEESIFESKVLFLCVNGKRTDFWFNPNSSIYAIHLRYWESEILKYIAVI